MGRPIELYPPAPVLTPRASLLEELLDCFARGPQLCLVIGPSGIGKTHLAREIQKQLGSLSQMVWAKGVPQAGGSAPFSAVRHLTTADRREDREVPVEFSHREALAGRLKEWSRSRHIVLCCDGIESFDAASLGWLISITRRLDRLPISLLLLLRERNRARSSERLWGEIQVAPRSARSFSVPPLSTEEMLALSSKYLRGPIKFSSGRIRWLLKLCRGNPLVLGEYIAYLREAGWISEAAGAWRLSPDTPVALPEFKELMSRRLGAAAAREPGFARDWIERGAIQGERFAVPVSVGPALARVGERTGYLKPIGSDGCFRFRHELVRSAIEAAAFERRPEVVREVMRMREEARVEEGVDLGLAHFYERAGALDLAIDEVGIAAVNATVTGFPSEAERLALWQDGLLARMGEPRESAPRLQAAELRAEALHAAGRFQELADYLRPLEDHAFRLRRPRLLLFLGAASIRLPESVPGIQARDLLQRALAVAQEIRDLHLLPDIHLELARAFRLEGDEGHARKSFFQALSLARRAKDARLESGLLRQARLFVEPALARRHAEDAVKLSRSGNLTLSQALALNNLGTILSELGVLTEAEHNYLDCLELLGMKGGWGVAVPLNNLALLAFYRGDLTEAAKLFGQAWDAADTYEVSFAIRCNRARLTSMEGYPAEAVREFRRLLGATEPLCQDLRSAAAFNLGRSLLEAGRPQEALEEAKAPPPWLGEDRDLAMAAWAALRLRAYRKLGEKRVPEAHLRSRAKVLDETRKCHSWGYKDLWARGEIRFD